MPAKQSLDLTNMINHSSALNHLAKELIERTSDWSKSDKGLGKPPKDVSGAILGAIIVGPFALELALKAFHFKKLNKKAPMTHDLVEIVKCLDSKAIAEIEQSFSTMRSEKYPQYAQANITALKVIEDWRNAFEDWRYLAEGSLPHVTQLREAPMLTDAILEIASK